MERYVALVPVKPPALGKSRLVGLEDDVRRALAAAFALDTVAACASPGLFCHVAANLKSYQIGYANCAFAWV